MPVDANKVLDAFYRLRQSHFLTRRPNFIREDAVRSAERYLDWCKGAQIDDPIAFLEYRFESARSAGHPVSIRALASEKLAGYWRTWAEGNYLEQKQAEKLTRIAGTRNEQAVKALRILTPGMEAAKVPYVSTSRHALCLAEIDITGGFHPDSVYCPTCPMAVRCAAALYREHGFDVVSLRAGRLNMLPKEIAAAAVR